MKMKCPMACIGIAALLVVGVACGGSESGDEASATSDTALQSAPAQTQIQPQTAPAPSSAVQIASPDSAPVLSAGSMTARALNADELFASAHLIVVATINSVLEEKQIGGYGPDGQLMPAEDGGIPVTDFDVSVETVVKDDGTVGDGEGFVLRMHGHAASDPSVGSSALFELPKVGGRLLFALGRNPEGTLGSGPEGLLDISGSIVTYADGQPFAAQTSPDQLIEDIRGFAVEFAALSEQTVTSHSATSGADGGMNEDEFLILLTRQDLAMLMSSQVALVTETMDMKEMAAGVDATQLETIESWFWLALTEFGVDRGLSFAVMDFDSEDAALAQYDKITGAESGLFAMTPPIGNASAHLDVNAGGIGGMLAFVAGDKLVTMHTAQSEELLPLVSLNTIEALAKTVESRF